MKGARLIPDRRPKHAPLPVASRPSDPATLPAARLVRVGIVVAALIAGTATVGIGAWAMTKSPTDEEGSRWKGERDWIDVYSIGTSFEYGHGNPRNLAEAAGWYRKAAEGGYAPAQIALARLYETGGEGFPADRAAALRWYRTAAEQGHELGRAGVARLAGDSGS